MSGDRAFGEGVHGFEEVARRLAIIGQPDMKLEVRLGAPDGQPPDGEAGAPGELQHFFGTIERRSSRVMHDHATRSVALVRRPLRRYSPEGLATGPACGGERFQFDSRGAVQYATEDNRVAAAASMAERPHPGYVARFEEDQDGRSGERGLAVADHHLDHARAQPAHRGTPAQQRQSALHPAHQLAPLADVPDRARCKPGDDRDRGDTDKLHHGGPDDSTPGARGWRRTVSEFLYGMSGYEIAQQALEIRAALETLFMLGVFGDMLGVPVLPPYYGLRLLPWVVPQIETWKRRVVRERELGSDHEHHLHGM